MIEQKRFTLKLLTGLIVAGTGLTMGASTALAQKAAAVSNPITTYTGADREKLLIEGAKKEGQLLVYTSAPVDDMTAVGKAFEKKYGIKVKIWRASGEKVVQRTLAEHRSDRFDVDIIETDGVEQEALHREKVLQIVKSPYQADLISAATQNADWTATRLNIFAAAYNTNLIKAADIPKSYSDLLDPKWKGKIGVEAEDIDWFAGVISELGEEKGLKLFRDIVSKNGISVRKGHTLLTNLVASGEVPMALTVYNYKAEQLKNKGAPLEWFTIPPAIARANGVSMVKGAPHPFAAVLFYDFMISDGQEVLFKRNFVPTSKKIKTKLNEMPLKFVDPKVILDENKKWSDLYEEIFTRQAK